MAERQLRLMPSGRALLAGSVVVAVVGWGFGFPELWVPASAGLCAVLGALVLGLLRQRTPAQVTVTRTLSPGKVVRGETAEVRLTVSVPADGRAVSGLVLRDQIRGNATDVPLGRLSPGSTVEPGYNVPTERRGLVELGPVGEVRMDPFGLVQVRRDLGESATLWVYPKVHPVGSLSSGQQQDWDGPTSDGAYGSITFHSLREYEDGDDLRLIHWRSTARTGKLMVRQQADPSQPHTTVVLDTHQGSYANGAAGGEDMFESAVEAAASVLVASVSQNFPARLLTGSGFVGGRQVGRAATTTMLDHLTTLDLSGETLANAASRLATESGGNGLVVITGSPDPRDLMAIETLRHRYATMAVVQFQPSVTPAAAWNKGVLDLMANDIGRFVALWNGQV